MKLSVTAKQMKEIDQFTINEIGVPSLVLMEQAALGITENILTEEGNIAIVCGPGNNGGDGIAIGRIAHLNNKNITLFLAGNYEKASEEAKTQLEIAKNLNMKIVDAQPPYNLQEFDVIVDAIFGIGLDREVASPLDEVIQNINQSQAKVIAVDIPSGLQADTGGIFNIAVKAHQTYTIGFNKKGFKEKESRKYTGELNLVKIAYPKVEMLKFILESTDE